VGGQAAEDVAFLVLSRLFYLELDFLQHPAGTYLRVEVDVHLVGVHRDLVFRKLFDHPLDLVGLASLGCAGRVPERRRTRSAPPHPEPPKQSAHVGLVEPNLRVPGELLGQ
jgi:hypothetical protein